MAEVKTCFKRVDYDLSNLLHYLELGDIGLPDIQRPFVWTNAKVRDLFDSMYKGFPVGYLLFWENAEVAGAKQIGKGDKQHKVANRLIVDGQQRLTSLYAVFRGEKVARRRLQRSGYRNRVQPQIRGFLRLLTPQYGATRNGFQISLRFGQTKTLAIRLLMIISIKSKKNRHSQPMKKN